MRHKIFGRQLSRTTKERKALFRNLISSLILHGQIKTTEAKAKAIKAEVDKVVSQAKKGTLEARRRLMASVGKSATDKLFSQTVLNFAARSSGFTTMIKLGPRKGDNAPIVLMKWIIDEQPKEAEKPKAKKSKTKEKKIQPEKTQKQKRVVKKK
ncbi:50S ribosomal protein L17 [Candidatus Microgenomates bacterium]|nr:50S ribosomal protein L17 [Candidatus Microgenomates bacterium]